MCLTSTVFAHGAFMTPTEKTYLITGATGGIGSALSMRLAQNGNRLVLASRDPGKLKTLNEGLAKVAGHPHLVLPVDMASDASIADFAKQLADSGVVLDGLVLMPPQAHSTNDCLPPNETWRTLFQDCFVGPLSLLKVAIDAMQPDPQNGRRCKIVIISGISSAQVLGHYATSNVLRCAWVGEAKTLAFAFGERGIHVNTLSLGGTLSPWYQEGLEKRARNAGVSVADRMVEETANVPLRKYGSPVEVAVAVEGLLSPFSDHMTGVNIMHDGGFTRAY